MNLLKKLLLGALLLGSAAAAAQHDHDHGPADGQRGARLVLSDALTNTVRVLDIDTAQVIGTFTVPGETAGTPVVTDSGRYAVLAHRDASRVTIIHSGLTVEDHGDHAHLLQASPFVLATMNVGRQPSHLVPAGRELLVFNDADGSIAILDEDLFGLSLNHGLIETGQPDHGAPLLIGDYVAAGFLNSGTVEVYDRDGQLLDSTAGCPRLHGSSLVGTSAVFGCADGVLLAEAQGERFDWTHLHYPAGTPEGVRVGAFFGSAGSITVGNLGSSLLLVNVRAGSLSTIELPDTLLSAAVSDGQAVALSADGSVSLIDLSGRDGQLLFTLATVTAAETDAGRPGLAVLGERAFVTDPAAGAVHILEFADLTITLSGTISVPGNPSALGVLLPAGDFQWH